MHRSRLSVLAILAASAACSTRDHSDTKILSQDPTLVATLEVRQKGEQPQLPDACSAVVVATQPAVANKPQAKELARQAYDAELLGKPQEARSLLLRASELDGTDKSAAYHLGRTSEALGDRTGATTAYCRYLALAPTAAESVEARQRLARLSQREPRMAAGSVSISAPTTQRVAPTVARRVLRERPTTGSRANTASVAQSAHGRSTERGTHSASPGTRAGDGVRTPGDGVTGDVDGSGRTAADGDVVATRGRVPNADQESTVSRTESRGSRRAQGAGIGVVAGAIMGAMAGRSVRSAVIGAAAGGIVGTVVGAVNR